MGVYLSKGASRVLWFLMALLVGMIAAKLTLQAYRSYTSKNWPVTQGVVGSFHETPHYRYSANGRSFVCDRVSWEEFLDRNVTIRNSEKYAVRYPLNASVTVHYHPDRPQLAVLDTKFDPKILKVLAVVLGVLLFCVLGIIFGWRWRVGGRVRFGRR